MKLIQEFIFDSYIIQPDRKTIDFMYKVGEFVFDETIILPQEIPTSISQGLLEKILHGLHLMLGISYYKMFCSKKIIVPYLLTNEQADFWNTVYTKGLGEFFYRNQIDFHGLINFPYDNGYKNIPLSEKRKDRAYPHPPTQYPARIQIF